MTEKSQNMLNKLEIGREELTLSGPPWKLLRRDGVPLQFAPSSSAFHQRGRDQTHDADHHQINSHLCFLTTFSDSQVSWEDTGT